MAVTRQEEVDFDLFVEENDELAFTAEILPDVTAAWSSVGSVSTFGSLSSSTKSSVGTVGSFS